MLRADEKRDSSPSPNPSSATDMQRSNIFSDLIYHSRFTIVVVDVEGETDLAINEGTMCMLVLYISVDNGNTYSYYNLINNNHIINDNE